MVLSVDASSEGLGAVLLQNQQPVAYASKPLTECQKRYVQIEKELLTILYGCEHFHQYIYGRTVVVETDHKPLEGWPSNRSDTPLETRPYWSYRDELSCYDGLIFRGEQLNHSSQRKGDHIRETSPSTSWHRTNIT